MNPGLALAPESAYQPLTGEKQGNIIKYIIDKATDEGIDLAVVTNGYNLKEYAEILSRGQIREVQVTLDGTEKIHNDRRPLKNGLGTFDAIVEGIDETLGKNIPINLRVVVDKDNIGELPGLAKFAEQKGWTKDPLFKTQLGRNYELHSCQSKSSQLFEREEMYRELYDLLKRDPSFADFFRPPFSCLNLAVNVTSLPHTGHSIFWTFCSSPVFDLAMSLPPAFAVRSVGRPVVEWVTFERVYHTASSKGNDSAKSKTAA